MIREVALSTFVAPSFWPTPQDYNEAIQSPHICIGDPDLKSASVDTNVLGLPKSMTGAFASVYKLTTADRSFAVRCFLNNRLEQHDRYRKVSEYVLMDELQCTIDFHYLEEGIKIRGEWFPLIKMPWIDGDTLDQHILKNYKDTESMKSLLSAFHGLMDELEGAGLGHGDLQHGNIIVSKNGLRLVDYDALFVPALAGKTSLEVGHPNYQHPERNASHYDQDVDNFSAWLIHTAILSIAIDPALYEKFCDGDDSLLFRRVDLANPDQSELFKTLLSHSSSHICEAATFLRRMLWAEPKKVPQLDASPAMLADLPTSMEARVKCDQEQPLETSAEVVRTTVHLTDFNFIDEDAALIRASLKPPETPTVRQRIRRILKKRWEGFQLWFSPSSYIQSKMEETSRLFERGDYDESLKNYLSLYKLMESTKQRESEHYFWCLLRLGCCYKASATPTLAPNYFLLALQNAGIQSTVRPALYLALHRYQTSDRAGALKQLKESKLKAGELPKVIKSELKHHLMDYISIFELLMSFGEQLLEENELELVADTACSAWKVLSKADRTKSLEVTDELVDKVVGLLLRVPTNDLVVAAYDDMAKFFHRADRPNRVSVAFIRSCLSVLGKGKVRGFANLKLGIKSMARAQPTDADLMMLKTSAGTAGSKEQERDVFLILAEQMIGLAAEEDRIAKVLAIACELTARHKLSLPEELFAALLKLNASLANCLESSLHEPKFVSALIAYLVSSEKLEFLALLAKSELDDGQFMHLARILTLVKFGYPEELFVMICQELDLSGENIDQGFDASLESLSNHLRQHSNPKSH